MKVKKQNLLLIACFVWLFAGFNILNIGISTYIKNINYINIININLSLLVFLLFWILTFSKLVVRHTNRIKNFNEEFLFF